MRVIVLYEKHEARFVKAGDTRRELDRAAEKVVQDRILDGHWYAGPGEQDEAVEAIQKGRSLDFLKSRSGYEHECIEIKDMDWNDL